MSTGTKGTLVFYQPLTCNEAPAVTTLKGQGFTGSI